jgi:hypothetical protein
LARIERDRQIEAPAVLGHIGRRKIHRDPALRVIELRIDDRGALGRALLSPPFPAGRRSRSQGLIN